MVICEANNRGYEPEMGFIMIYPPFVDYLLSYKPPFWGDFPAMIDYPKVVSRIFLSSSRSTELESGVRFGPCSI